MSIIYDALQKTQQRLLRKNNDDYSRRSFSWIDVVLVIIIIGLLSAVIFAYYPFIKKYFSEHSVAKTTVVEPALVLNGIFFSDQEKMAMINNQSLRIGEMIAGMKIIEIDTTTVKLQDGDKIITLTTPA